MTQNPTTFARNKYQIYFSGAETRSACFAESIVHICLKCLCGVYTAMPKRVRTLDKFIDRVFRIRRLNIIAVEILFNYYCTIFLQRITNHWIYMNLYFRRRFCFNFLLDPFQTPFCNCETFGRKPILCDNKKTTSVVI